MNIPLGLEKGMITPPSSITLSGVDDGVNFDDLKLLCNLYDVEFGILAEPGKHGKKRYPSRAWLANFVEQVQAYEETVLDENNPSPFKSLMRTSLHLCGDYLEAFMEAGYCGLEHLLPGFDRVQFNLGSIEFTRELREMISSWSAHYSVQAIIQVPRFPVDDDFDYLLDTSRGKGVSRSNWDTSELGHVSRYRAPGFAGGINPKNILETCFQINRHTTYYCLDMETGVRDEDNEFSIEKAHAVCEAVWDKMVIHNDQVMRDEDVLTPEQELEIRLAEERRIREREDREEFLRQEAVMFFQRNLREIEYRDQDRRWWIRLTNGQIVRS